MCVRVRVFATGSVWPSDEESTLSRFESGLVKLVGGSVDSWER